jgi:hypothetical protein
MEIFPSCIRWRIGGSAGGPRAFHGRRCRFFRVPVSLPAFGIRFGAKWTGGSDGEAPFYGAFGTRGDYRQAAARGEGRWRSLQEAGRDRNSPKEPGGNR